MVVAVITVGMVQVSAYQVVDVVTVGHCGVAAVRAVHVAAAVSRAVVRDAALRIGVRDGYGVLVIMVVMGTVKVPVVQVAHMVTVPDGDVAAIRTVLMVVVFVDDVCHESSLPAS